MSPSFVEDNTKCWELYSHIGVNLKPSTTQLEIDFLICKNQAVDICLTRLYERFNEIPYVKHIAKFLNIASTQYIPAPIIIVMTVNPQKKPVSYLDHNLSPF